MGPIPELPNLKWLMLFAAFGIGSAIGLIVVLALWLIEHVRIV